MPLPRRVFSGAFCERVVKGSGLSGKKAAKVSCEDCFFKRNGLCALT